MAAVIVMIFLFIIGFLTANIRHEEPYRGYGYEANEKKRQRNIKIDKAINVFLAVLMIVLGIYLLFS